jgi:hypothetical protein
VSGDFGEVFRDVLPDRRGIFPQVGASGDGAFGGCRNEPRCGGLGFVFFDLSGNLVGFGGLLLEFGELLHGLDGLVVDAGLVAADGFEEAYGGGSLDGVLADENGDVFHLIGFGGADAAETPEAIGNGLDEFFLGAAQGLETGDVARKAFLA